MIFDHRIRLVEKQLLNIAVGGRPEHRLTVGRRKLTEVGVVVIAQQIIVAGCEIASLVVRPGARIGVRVGTAEQLDDLIIEYACVAVDIDAKRPTEQADREQPVGRLCCIPWSSV